MRLIGLTGGIGAGKSTVSTGLAAKGAAVIDADAIVRELQQPGTVVFTEMVERFGPGIVAADGELDRAAIAEVVFTDETALADLGAIVHPRVHDEIERRLDELRADTDRVVILDVPLLVESGWEGMLGTIVVDLHPDVAVQRLVEHRGFTEEDARNRIAQQATREHRLSKRRLRDRQPRTPARARRRGRPGLGVDPAPLDDPTARTRSPTRPPSRAPGVTARSVRSVGELFRDSACSPSRCGPSRSCRTSSRRATSPAAIAALAEGVNTGQRFQTLLGITGSGKSATMAWTIEQVQRPTLVLAPNKSLAAQLANEFREFFPDNRVEYFVSYYDYYQPEAYIASSDTFIEKDSSVNDEIDRLRHAATSALLTRRDVIVVASVSCIYGLGSPEEYASRLFAVRVGDEVDQRDLLRRLVDLQYERNDMNLVRGKFRVRGDVLEVHPAYEESAVRIELFGDEVESISVVDPLTGERVAQLDDVVIFPNTHYATSDERLGAAIGRIETELQQRLAQFEARGQAARGAAAADAHRVRPGDAPGDGLLQRHRELLRAAWTAADRVRRPHTLLDFFPDDYLTIIDESHVTIPQLHGQYEGDRSRKATLVEHGFRLPSAADNRPLRFEEWVERAGQTVFLSATPGPWELEHSTQVVEQIVRPTGLIDPEVVIKPTKGQIDDLLAHDQRARRRPASGCWSPR